MSPSAGFCLLTGQSADFLSEAVQQYREIGFEVLIEPVDTSSEECTSCLTVMSDRYKITYTRPKKE